ncbi:MAG: hypothetical protein EBY80_12570 [Actinobacteria bacterium]|nr:hypothetical protein [Actinomycetota bacterium]NDA78372.1 hypothetical protein [Actinomycetota bacterium]
MVVLATVQDITILQYQVDIRTLLHVLQVLLFLVGIIMMQQVNTQPLEVDMIMQHQEDYHS